MLNMKRNSGSSSSKNNSNTVQSKPHENETKTETTLEEKKKKHTKEKRSRGSKPVKRTRVNWLRIPQWLNGTPYTNAYEALCVYVLLIRTNAVNTVNCVLLLAHKHTHQNSDANKLPKQMIWVLGKVGCFQLNDWINLSVKAESKRNFKIIGSHFCVLSKAKTMPAYVYYVRDGRVATRPENSKRAGNEKHQTHHHLQRTQWLYLHHRVQMVK